MILFTYTYYVKGKSMKKMKNRKVSGKVNAYFKKQDRARKRKKIAFITLLFLVSGVITIFKAPMFEVKLVKISGNKMIKKEGVLNNKFVLGKNIFLLDTNEVKRKILENPYIQTADVKRTIPNGIDVKVTERKMFYKMKLDEKVYILNNELYIMDIVDSDENLSLVEVKGIKIDSITIGERITLSDEISRVAYELAQNLIDKNKDSIFSKIDLSDKNDVSIYKNDVEIILGEISELDEKYKIAMEILNSNKVNLVDGYIDISVPSQPVIKNNVKDKKEDVPTLDNGQVTEVEEVPIQIEGEKLEALEITEVENGLNVELQGE